MDRHAARGDVAKTPGLRLIRVLEERGNIVVLVDRIDARVQLARTTAPGGRRGRAAHCALVDPALDGLRLEHLARLLESRRE